MIEFRKKKFLLVIFSLSFLTLVHAEYNHFGIPDSAEIRKSIQNEWLRQDVEFIRMQNSQVRKSNSGESFQITFEEQDQKFIVYVSPKIKVKIDVYDSTGVHTQTEESFSPTAIGSWMYVRNKSDGTPDFIRLYISKNSDIYIQFKPHKNTTYVDFVVYNAYVTKSAPLGIPFENLFTLGIEEIYSLTKNTIPWELVQTKDDYLYDSKLVMVQTLRSLENKIAYEQDAMYNELAKPVSIQTGKPYECKEKNKDKLVLSSCGFVKWVVDGLVQPLAGSYLKREPLLNPTFEYKATGYQGALNSIYSINFSLDWTRNLAAAAYSVRARKTYYYKDIELDVIDRPFSVFATNKGNVNIMGYIKNSGYKPEYLKPLLYTLAIKEPDNFYLAAIRQTDKKSAEVKAFNDAAVIFPYLDQNGIFKIVVFMDGQEIKFNDFVNYLLKTNDCFVNLVRIKSSKTFYPQEKNN